MNGAPNILMLRSNSSLSRYPDSGRCGRRLQLDGRDRIRESVHESAATRPRRAPNIERKEENRASTRCICRLRRQTLEQRLARCHILGILPA